MGTGHLPSSRTRAALTGRHPARPHHPMPVRARPPAVPGDGPGPAGPDAGTPTMKEFSLRLPPALIARPDALAERQNADPQRGLKGNFRRSDVAREALIRGIQAIEAELAPPRARARRPGPGIRCRCRRGGPGRRRRRNRPAGRDPDRRSRWSTKVLHDRPLDPNPSPRPPPGARGWRPDRRRWWGRPLMARAPRRDCPARSAVGRRTPRGCAGRPAPSATARRWCDSRRCHRRSPRA